MEPDPQAIIFTSSLILIYKYFGNNFLLKIYGAVVMWQLGFDKTVT
jgi:hypothetical protein